MSTYRPDIDGLRAICIVSVVMFHAGFHDWAGGFVGVDVFFVISGYLITSLIGRQIAAGQFDLLAFYERRIRRLLPATIPVILFATLFALTFYTSGDLLSYCKSLIAFVGYSSNWFFFGETGYFATPPETSPLLHTWSLAVEEQFYLIFPALLLILMRFQRSAAWILVALAILSLAYAQVEISRGHLEWTFFGSFSRFWELLAGAILAFVPTLKDRTAAVALPMRVIGIAMIGTSVFSYGPGTPFPGTAALLPVCGALLLLTACPNRPDLVWRLLASNPMVYLGKISYSLYLWHWPVLGAVRTLVLKYNDLDIALAIAISVGLASMSYHFLEQPVRMRRKLARGRHMGVLLASTSVLAAAVGWAGWSASGWPNRFPPDLEAKVARAGAQADLPAWCVERPEIANGRLCEFGGPHKGRVDLLLWGDSHAHSLLPPFQKYAETRGLSFALALRNGCPPLLDTGRERRARKGTDRGCPVFNNAVRTFIHDKDVPIIVLAARWSFYAHGHVRLADLKSGREGTPGKQFESAIVRTFDALQNRAIAIVQQVPEQNGRVPSAYVLLNRLGRSPDEMGVDRAQHEKHQRIAVDAMNQVASRENALLIDPSRELCGPHKCIVEKDGKLLYLDAHHLNIDGSLVLYPLLESEIDALLGRLQKQHRH